MSPTRLRSPRPDEAAVLSAWRDEVTSPFEDLSGDPPPGVQPAPPVSGQLAGGGILLVVDRDDVPVGDVAWRPVLYGPNPGSRAFDLGLTIRPEARGQGHGWRAQALLAEHLFATTDVHRVQACTDVDNVAERRALERAGFTAEGVLRGAQWRQGRYRDLVGYARLRTDA